MKLSEYHAILEKIHSRGGGRRILPTIAKEHPGVSVNTIGSIQSQDYQRKMRKTHYRHYNTSTMERYYQTFLERVKRNHKHVLLDLAKEIDLSPALLSRIIVERYLVHTEFNGEIPPRSVVSKLTKDPHQIKDAKLSNEVTLCLYGDDNYGHLADTIKHSIGHEYEFLLQKKVEEHGLAYLGEDDMRAKGYDKTPDIKLEVPIAVNGQVVNWIESKASFGDEESHKGYLKEQFWSYWNRFGPGLVIYWFGFIDELDVNKDKGIMLMDHFPEEIILMDPSTT